MQKVRSDEISKYIGSDVYDEFGRLLGTLVAAQSNIDGWVEEVAIKIADKSIEVVEGDRVKISDGKVLVVPEWKYEITKLIDNLDRAYKKRKAVEAITGSSDLPSVVIDPIKKTVEDEIKALKIKAEEVRKGVVERLRQIEDEELRVAKALAMIRIAYFSGEVGERAYNQGVNSLRKVQDALGEEKKAAKDLLDKLDKILQMSAEPAKAEPAKKEEAHAAEAPVAAQAPQALVVKIES